MSYFTKTLNVFLGALVIMSCFVFFIAFNNKQNPVLYGINSWLLILSGLLINAGTLIQIIGSAMNKSNVICFNYLTCLVCGCFLLFSGQVFTYVHKNVHDSDFLISLVGSFLSFFFTSAMMTMNKINEYREKRRNSMNLIDNHESLYQDQNRSIVYLEGTSGIGKTTTATSNSYDFLYYLKKHSEFKDKVTLPYIQTLYNMQLYADVYMDIIDFSKNSLKLLSLNDRFIFSQLAYDIIFHFNGAAIEPKIFKTLVDDAIFKNAKMVSLIRESMIKIMELAEMCGVEKIKVLWFIASDPEFTKNKILERGSFESTRNDWNLIWYIQNQNYIFSTLHLISGIGQVKYVKLISSNDC